MELARIDVVWENRTDLFRASQIQGKCAFRSESIHISGRNKTHFHTSETNSKIFRSKTNTNKSAWIWPLITLFVRIDYFVHITSISFCRAYAGLFFRILTATISFVPFFQHLITYRNKYESFAIIRIRNQQSKSKAAITRGADSPSRAMYWASLRVTIPDKTAAQQLSLASSIGNQKCVITRTYARRSLRTRYFLWNVSNYRSLCRFAPENDQEQDFLRDNTWKLACFHAAIPRTRGFLLNGTPVQKSLTAPICNREHASPRAGIRWPPHINSGKQRIP